MIDRVIVIDIEAIGLKINDADGNDGRLMTVDMNHHLDKLATVDTVDVTHRQLDDYQRKRLRLHYRTICPRIGEA